MELCQSASVEDIESSFLSQIRFELRDEPLLTRCVHVWQAIDARLRNVELTINEIRAQPVDLSQVDLGVMKELRTLRRGMVGAFIDSCIKELGEAHASAEEAVKDSVSQCDEELKRLKVQFEAERKQLLAELEMTKTELNQELKSREQELERRLEKTNSVNQELHAKLTSLESDKSDVESLRKELRELSSHAEQKEAELRLRAENFKKEKRTDSILKELMEEKERRVATEKQLAQEEAKLKQVEFELSREVAERLALEDELSEKEAQLRKEAEQHVEDAARLKGALAELRGEQEKRVSTEKQLALEVSELNQDGKFWRIDKKRGTSDLLLLESELRKKEAQLSDSEATLEKTRLALNLASQNMAEYKARVAELSKGAADMASESVKVEARLRSQVYDANQKILLLNKDKESLTERLATAVEKERVTQRAYQDLQARFKALKNTYDLLAKQVFSRFGG